MRLRLQVHEVRTLAWAAATGLREGVLDIDRQALEAELLQDSRLMGVDLQLAAAGEACRIVPVFDVIEPRAKLEPRGADFPGVLTPVQAVGVGTTRVLRGMAVTVLDPKPLTNRMTVLDLQVPILRDGAPGERFPYASLQHLVVSPRPDESLDINEHRSALRLAGLRAAAWLARQVDTAPDGEEAFELQLAEGLPRVAYIFQIHSHQRPTVPGEGLLYGDNCRHLLPTILHPNEAMDGAVLCAYDSNAMTIYGIQNHAVIRELYARHGREVDFAGVVINVANQLAEERARCTLLSANLAKWVMQADGVVLTKSGGGAPHVDMALVAERCEQLGMKTTMLAWDLSEPEDGAEGGALFNSPLLDAIVSIGSNGTDIPLPPVERVIAPTPTLAERYQGQTAVSALRAISVMDHLGSSRLTAALY
jgi:sarcosine reductase